MLGAGLFLFIGRFLVDAWLRNRTRYLLTDRHASIERTGPFAGDTIVDLHAVADLHLTREWNGFATIRFGAGAPSVELSRAGVRFWVPSLDPVPQFLLLRDAEHVFELVLGARN